MGKQHVKGVLFSAPFVGFKSIGTPLNGRDPIFRAWFFVSSSFVFDSPFLNIAAPYAF